jgi:DNA primase
VTGEGLRLAVGVVAEIKGRLPVADVVGETVQLKKAGTTLKGLCPFHGEKTPSFVVTPARDTWHCFGCSKHGDIFTFVMERDSVGFPEALKSLAARAGVELDERTKAEDLRNARLRGVLESAVAFYHAVLMKSKQGEPALAYLRGRGFTDEIIEKHQLGWAPGGWDSLARQLASKRQVHPQDLLDTGLASPRQRGGGVYDRFRERVIFPIRDTNGHAVGLGGRILGKEGEDGKDTGPKYLNSPATSLFDKSRTLYLIDRAKSAIRKTGQAVIVEGYTDALMAHQAGFENVVASLGTALTPQQVALITRYAKRIALAYDVDAAGEKAGTFGATALEELIRQLASDETGVELDDVRVVRLPEGKDPDEVMRDTPDEWREEVRTARPIVDHLIDVHAREHDMRQPGGQARFVDAVMPIIRNLPNPVMRDAYLGRIRQVSGVEERTLFEALRRRRERDERTGGAAGTDRRDRFSAAAVTNAPDALPVTEILRGVSRTEQELLRLVLLVPEAHDDVLDGLGPDRLPSQVARELYRAVVEARARDDAGIRPPWSLPDVLASLDEESRALGQALISRPGPNPRDLGDRSLAYEIEALTLELDDAEWQERSAYNRDATAEAERDGDSTIVQRLLLERRLLNEQRRSLDKRRDQTRLLSRPAVATG